MSIQTHCPVNGYGILDLRALVLGRREGDPLLHPASLRRTAGFNIYSVLVEAIKIETGTEALALRLTLRHGRGRQCMCTKIPAEEAGCWNKRAYKIVKDVILELLTLLT